MCLLVFWKRVEVAISHLTSKTTVITTTELLDCSTALSANRSSILKADRPLSHRGVSIVDFYSWC